MEYTCQWLYIKLQSEPTEDIAETVLEDIEDGDKEEEGFVLDRNVTGTVLPDMSQDFRRIIQKVAKHRQILQGFFTELRL